MILLIDNYDSFTFNLVQALGAIGVREPALCREIRVVRNDETAIDALAALQPSRLIISPGPGTPDESGLSRDAIRHFMGRIPILGVCLGHQCIADLFGSPARRAARIMHGKTSAIHHDGKGIFEGLPNPFAAMRYHSLTIEPGELGEEFDRSAWTSDGECMAIRHRAMRIDGVQFHPESFATPDGARLLQNFIADETPAATADHSS